MTNSDRQPNQTNAGEIRPKSTFAQIVSAITSVIAAGAACAIVGATYWAIFYSPTSKALVDWLQTELTMRNQQIVILEARADDLNRAIASREESLRLQQAQLQQGEKDIKSLTEESLGLQRERDALAQLKDQLETNNAALAQNFENLKAVRAEHILQVKQPIIDAVVSSLESEYKKSLEACDQVSALEELRAWVERKKEIEKEIARIRSDTTLLRQDWRTAENVSAVMSLVREEQSSIPKAFSDEIMTAVLLDDCRDCDSGDEINPSKYYVRKRADFMTPKKGQTGMEIVKSVSSVEQVKLLPSEDREKLKLFLQDYVSNKSETYKAKTRPQLREDWNFKQMRDQAQKVRIQIQLMQNDLPNLRLAAGTFFVSLTK